MNQNYQMAEIQVIEENVLIANRVPPGDNWRVVGSNEVTEGLVMALTKYMRENNFKGNYRLEPLNGKLFAIKCHEEEVVIPEPMKFDLYGEY